MTDLDLNLVKTFVLLYETRSVTRTAEALFLTQPSASHALRRLRRHFGDELFVRATEGLRPTEAAERMYPRLRQALEVITETVSDEGTFDPSTSRRTFRLSATDLGELILLPAVLAELEARAPHCRIEVTPLDSAAAAEELRRGRVDAVICTPRIDAPDIRRDPLFQERYVGLRATDHPRIGDRPEPAEYLAERHIAVAAAAGHVDADQVLARLGHPRDIVAHVPHFAVLPELVARTGYLAVVPSRAVRAFTRAAPVRTFTLPFDIPTVEVALHTYRRTLPAPAVEWLRATVTGLLASSH
ncbi:LysR family transcriptional regulator [Streptomyces sp. NPDC042319]|uniref:LysR family transcriptional regulator n=1 Tax=Streptomyces sp. NPDC042319 TaxID=3154332 RepID=UPI00341193D1